MSVDQLAHKRDASKLPTTAKVKPSVYISPEVVREIFEGVPPPSWGAQQSVCRNLCDRTAQGQEQR
jgi:hypothetical protein